MSALQPVSICCLFNAREYVYQGSTIPVDAGYTKPNEFDINTLVKDGSTYKNAEGKKAFIAVTAKIAYLDGYSLYDYFGSDKEGVYGEAYQTLLTMAKEAKLEGFVPYTDETVGLLSSVINVPDWQEDDSFLCCYLGFEYEFPELSFDEVGFKADDTDNSVTLILNSPLELLDKEGKLTYHCAYDMQSLPLVKRDLWEANKIQPSGGSSLVTSKYNSSLATSASWGPYKLTKFQAGKEYQLERNPYWYGYNMSEYEGQFQTDIIHCETIEKFETQWLKFRNGEIDGIGIDVSISNDYKNSSRALFTPSDFVASMQLQSLSDGLITRSDENTNKTILLQPEFRKAISLCLNRDEFATTCTTASKKGFGLFNSMHYYDVAHGGIYRDTVQAKKIICDVYGVEYTEETLDEAYNSVTGYDLNAARELLVQAIEAEKKETRTSSDGKKTTQLTLTGDQKVVLTFGSSSNTEALRRRYDYLKSSFEKLAVGTELEGKLTCDFDTSFGDKWADDFRAGKYDICLGGWSGAAWNPGYFLAAYLDPANMYSTGWDTSSQMLTFDPQDPENPGEKTMSLIAWYACLNGTNGAPYNWAEGMVDNEVRLNIIAALEGEVLKAYYTVPMYNDFSAELVSYKIDYKTTTYNTFMGYGGIRYMTFNFNNGEWWKVKGNYDYKL